jgi:hypothetical protein
MNSGTRFFMQGNAERGDEDNGFRRVNNRSLPMLFREGLVDFCNTGKKLPHCWYSVTLTPDGKSAAWGALTRKERGIKEP